MRTLVIDSATESCSVALFGDDRLIVGECLMLGRGHAERLVPMIAALPDKGRADRIAVSLGPGSFTGVRVGLAAARALAFAWDAQLVGYPTLALVAAIARARAGAQPVCVAMTGGHGEWFVAEYDADGSETAPVASLTPERAARTSTKLVAGTQARALSAIRGSGQALELWPDARAFPQLSSSALIANVHPIYGRAPDARLPSAS